MSEDQVSTRRRLLRSLSHESVADCVSREAPHPSDDPHRPTQWRGQAHGLTLVESRVVEMITLGLSNLAIADRLFLSINTVKSYIRSSYRKIAVTSRSEAVLWGVEHDFHPRLGPRTVALDKADAISVHAAGD